MEKLLYPVWKARDEDPAAFNERLLGEVAPKLIGEGVQRLQINVVDDAVAPAAGSRIEATKPAIQALVSMWVDTAVFRAPLEGIVAAAVERYAAYLATESEPIPNSQHRTPDGERTPGYSQVVFLQVPPRLTHSQWLDYWQGTHTHVGIEQQSNFRYVQNVIVRPLGFAMPRYDAIVEECFPAEAMTDPHVFYDAIGDEAKFKKNLEIMMESCKKFIDFDRIDCIPTSEYVMKS